jgi:hypothetical protein
VLAEHVLAKQARQAVYRVGGREQRAPTLPREPDRGRGGEDCLAHAALAAEEKILLRGMLAKKAAHRHRDLRHGGPR